ncbi:MAG: PQQ-binding-like beta-propeller repeat protein [Phycisphaerae bacterium]
MPLSARRRAANSSATQRPHGREAWRYEVDSPLIASPAIAQGVIVIGGADGVVYCFGERK